MRRKTKQNRPDRFIDGLFPLFFRIGNLRPKGIKGVFPVTQGAQSLDHQFLDAHRFTPLFTVLLLFLPPNYPGHSYNPVIPFEVHDFDALGITSHGRYFADGDPDH